MVQEKIKRAEDRQGTAKEKHLQIEGAQGGEEVDQEDDHNRDPPPTHVVTAKPMPKRDRRLRRQRDRVGKAIGEVNQPGGEEKQEADGKIQLGPKNTAK